VRERSEPCHASVSQHADDTRGVAAPLLEDAPREAVRDEHVVVHGEGLPHKHEHRLDQDEIKPRHWFTRTGLTNGRHANLHTHTTLPTVIVATVRMKGATRHRLSGAYYSVQTFGLSALSKARKR
jgi:hypothetical protein